MPQPVVMPRLDKDMEEGRVAIWHKSEGDRVCKGDVLFEIETDKAAVEVEAEHAGTLHHIALNVGESAPVESVLAWIFSKGEEVGSPPAQKTNAPQLAAQDDADVAAKDFLAQSALGQTESATISSEERIIATPVARAEAEARGLSLVGITGTGPSGRIQKSDILHASIAQDITKNGSVPPAGIERQPGPLSIMSSGSGDRLPMVMIHGLLADASGWDKLVKLLAQKRRMHLIELPCHGRSPVRSVANFADLVGQLRDAFDGIETERCHLVGHSLGGALALALADTRPRRVESLTMISPAGLGPEINGDAIRGMCRATRAESLGPWMKLLTSDPDAMGWSYVQAAAAARRDEALRASQTAMADALLPDGVQAFDLRAAIDRLTMPARIIWGRDDQIIPWKQALHAPGHVSLNLFRGVGHMPHYEVPEKIEPLLTHLA